jgi:type VI secretion system secreted protein Hcp
MAETVHLTLKHKGKQIEGESTQTTNGRENTIECLYWEQEVETATEPGSGTSTGRRHHQPVVIRKRLDKATPILMKALTENQDLEAEFKFYRPAPGGDGSTEQFYTVVLNGARIVKIKKHSPDALAPAANASPPLEELHFKFHTIHWTYNPTGAQHEDKWSGGK